MQIVLLAIGKTKLKGVADLLDIYVKRLPRFCKFDMHVLPDVKNSQSLPPAILAEKESESFLQVLKSSDWVVLLDEKGFTPNSNELAAKMSQWQHIGKDRIVFVIGGAYGHGKVLQNRADFKLSLSSLTFNHQMVRAIFVEQLYRAFSILHNLPYHND